MNEEEAHKHIEDLEAMTSDIKWGTSTEEYNKAIQDIKDDPVKNELWAKGAAAKLFLKRKPIMDRVEKSLGGIPNNHIPEAELLELSREYLSTDPGSYHIKYKEEDLTSEELLKSEDEAGLDVKKDFYSTVAKGQIKNIAYGDEEDKKDVVSYEARNYNEHSTPISAMTEEDQKRIQRNAALNFHAAEDAIGYKDIRTKLVNGDFVIQKEYSAEESKSRFKFTRENIVENDTPLCKFFINDELIYTMDVEAAAKASFPVKLEYTEMVEQGIDSLNPLERLCHEITRKAGILIAPDEIYGYLESGYLINGDDRNGAGTIFGT